MDQFIDCVVKEIYQAADRVSDLHFDSLYIGGGTPSLLSPRHLERVVLVLEQALDLGSVDEFTIEANPGEAPAEKLGAFHNLGVNRLSLGFQSFDPALLKFLGRRHAAEDCRQTFDAARRAGFDNISADLLFNIPGQSLRRWQSDLTALVAMDPEHISIYSLTVEEGTPLHDLVKTGEVAMPPEETDAMMYSYAREYLSNAGYTAYEIGNYALDDKACRHNLHYWRIEPYLGFGPSAHSFDGFRRYWNVRSLDEYLERIAAGRSPISGEESLNPVRLHNERLAFGLRLIEGISVTTDLGYESVVDFKNRFGSTLAYWNDRLILAGDRLMLTEQGVLLADAIAAELLLEEDISG